jgi:hypothetical protein
VTLGVTFQHSELSTEEPLSVIVRYFLPRSVKYANAFNSTSRISPVVTLGDDNVLEFKVR